MTQASRFGGTIEQLNKRMMNSEVGLRHSLFYYSIILLFYCSFFARQAAASEGRFSASDLIMEHLTDGYQWHLLTWKGHHISVPLPVILYHPDRGLSVFLSSGFKHGAAICKGYKLEHNRIVAVSQEGATDELATAKIIDISITKNVAAILCSILLMAWLFISAARTYAKSRDSAPRGFQSWLEPVIVFVRDEVARPNIGEEKYVRYMPFLLTLFFFILINNLLGLIPLAPGGANVTGNITVTMTLALFTFLITTFTSNRHYWRHIFAMPGVPLLTLLILTPIELLGVLLRPAVLMIRLFANMLSGHIVLLSFFSMIFIFSEISPAVGIGLTPVALAFTLFMTLLKILVAFIQAYVFALLSALYFGAAIEESGH